MSSMAVMTGVVFLIVFIFAPRRGLISILRRRRNQKIQFAKMTLLFHLHHHEGSEHEMQEAGVDTIQAHLHWDVDFAKRIMSLLEKENRIEFSGGVVKLTDYGRMTSIRSYESLF